MGAGSTSTYCDVVTGELPAIHTRSTMQWDVISNVRSRAKAIMLFLVLVPASEALSDGVECSHYLLPRYCGAELVIQLDGFICKGGHVQTIISTLSKLLHTNE
jgi:hypothetical protein